MGCGRSPLQSTASRGAAVVSREEGHRGRPRGAGVRRLRMRPAGSMGTGEFRGPAAQDARGRLPSKLARACACQYGKSDLGNAVVLQLFKQARTRSAPVCPARATRESRLCSIVGHRRGVALQLGRELDARCRHGGTGPAWDASPSCRKV